MPEFLARFGRHTLLSALLVLALATTWGLLVLHASHVRTVQAAPAPAPGGPAAGAAALAPRISVAPHVLAQAAGFAYAGETRLVRHTFFLERGVMRSGVWTFYGAISCGHHWPMGTVLQTADGRQWTCLDRGAVEPDGVDVWEPSYAEGLADIEGPLGLWNWVTVVSLGALPY